MQTTDTIPQTGARRTLGPIASLSNREAYIDIGRRNTTPGAPDDETVIWAMEATVARVADEATDEDRERILAWVREGELSADVCPVIARRGHDCGCADLMGRALARGVPEQIARVAKTLLDGHAAYREIIRAESE